MIKGIFKSKSHNIFLSNFLEKRNMQENFKYNALSEEISDNLRLDNQNICSLSDIGILYDNTKNRISSDEYISLISELGELIHETSPYLKDYVEKQFILNIFPKVKKSMTKSDETFSPKFLSMHTEHSILPLKLQPKYISLYCIKSDSTSKTILVSFKSVFESLSESTIKILKNVSYDSNDINHSILTIDEENNPIFSFRDYYEEGLKWKCSDNNANINSINNAFSELLKSIYNKKYFKIVQWHENDLLIFDNTKYFHCRTELERNNNRDYRLLLRLKVKKDET